MTAVGFSKTDKIFTKCKSPTPRLLHETVTKKNQFKTNSKVSLPELTNAIISSRVPATTKHKYRKQGNISPYQCTIKAQF